MPHKRAKRSVRMQQRSESGADLAPRKDALSTEAIPKGAARILNAAQIQKEWSEKKRKLEDGGGEDAPGRKRRKQGDASEASRAKADVKMKIQPGESMAHFNRRVEDSMRGEVRAAMQTSSALERRTRKEEQEKKKRAKEAKKLAPPALSTNTKPAKTPAKTAGTEDAANTPQKTQRSERAKEFQIIASSAPKRLNDIVQAPPELKKPARGAAKIKAAKLAAGDGGAGTTLRQGALSMAQKAMLEEERVRAVRLYREMKKGNAV